MQFDWDPEKEKRNLSKHGITFLEASSVFGEPRAVTFSDPDHSGREPRWITLGFSLRGRLLFVAHAERGEVIRVISARKASRKEYEIYEQG